MFPGSLFVLCSYSKYIILILICGFSLAGSLDETLFVLCNKHAISRVKEQGVVGNRRVDTVDWYGSLLSGMRGRGNLVGRTQWTMRVCSHSSRLIVVVLHALSFNNFHLCKHNVYTPEHRHSRKIRFEVRKFAQIGLGDDAKWVGDGKKKLSRRSKRGPGKPIKCTALRLAIGRRNSASKWNKQVNKLTNCTQIKRWYVWGRDESSLTALFPMIWTLKWIRHLRAPVWNNNTTTNIYSAMHIILRHPRREPKRPFHTYTINARVCAHEFQWGEASAQSKWLQLKILPFVSIDIL